METGNFIIDFKDFENKLKLFFILRNFEIFSAIADRIILGTIYPDLVSPWETVTDVVHMLNIAEGPVPLALNSDEERDQFAAFLVKIIPSLKNSGYRPYNNMPVD